MAATRFYLIRRDLRQFLGPMTSDEFRRSLARLDFGLQDEISGHCGPWVVLDRKDELKSHYPEIASLLGDSLPLSWRETTSHARVISRHRSKGDKSGKAARRGESSDGLSDYLKKKKRKSRATMLFAVALFIAAGVLATGIILKKMDDVPPMAELVALSEKGDPTDFLNVMGLKVIPQAAKIAKSQKNLSTWLPMLRMYAYYTSGGIEGVSQKILKGEAPAAFNHDCTVEGWKRKWKESTSQTMQFLTGRSLQKNSWTKLLSMDPNWIRRRPQKGWTKPRNLYEGCLMTASVAMRSMAGDLPAGGDSGQEGVHADVLTSVSRRLQNQLEIVHGVPVTGLDETSVEGSSILGVLTCLESKPTVLGLADCRALIDPGLDPVVEEHFGLALIKLVVAQGQGMPDAQWKASMQGVSSKLFPEDVMSHLELGAESKLLSYLAGGLSIEQAIEKTGMDFPEIKFK
jgi:hypothetical protein